MENAFYDFFYSLRSIIKLTFSRYFIGTEVFFSRLQTSKLKS